MAMLRFYPTTVFLAKMALDIPLKASSLVAFALFVWLASFLCLDVLSLSETLCTILAFLHQMTMMTIISVEVFLIYLTY